MDPDAGLTMVAVKENDAEMVRQAEDTFRSFHAAHGVKERAARGGGRLLACFVIVTWHSARRAARTSPAAMAACSTSSCWRGRERHGRARRWWTLESALFESGRPVLIAPPTSPRSLGTRVLIAWNRSTEQARATAFAMPLLRLAERITILTIRGPRPWPDRAAWSSRIRYG